MGQIFGNLETPKNCRTMQVNMKEEKASLSGGRRTPNEAGREEASRIYPKMRPMMPSNLAHAVIEPNNENIQSEKEVARAVPCA
ncbi:hypothetical protein EVAR_43955_1 [Eumeta japonica]|uniref:Uncharacterized protein n=1 Tax=Eumeta variegata TaxID=151549 RepID=A0A4C1Y0Y4_EUMVA|nr:hypothetical protein EVAR_43955_1 [Eumeta japonica]